MPKRKAASSGNRTPAKRTMGATTSQTNTKTEHVEHDTLQGYGLHFKNNKLVSIDSDEPFKFNAHTNPEDNQKRYESIGKLVDEAIFDLLETQCHLNRVTVPIDPKRGEHTSFIFTSKNLSTADFLMLIIHGTGVVRAGQWSRKLAMNESLIEGSQFEYIRRAQNAGYGVIVTNTNLNYIETSRVLRHRSPHSIRGSSSAEEHGCYVWEHFVREHPAPHICIMAHSYGGAVVLNMASRFKREFNQRVFAVALTDSPVSVYGRRIDKKVLAMLKTKTINWVVDSSDVDTDLGEDDCCVLRSAGHLVHEWTSHTAIDAVFNFFTEERRKLDKH